jgi:hypothetical protein
MRDTSGVDTLALQQVTEPEGVESASYDEATQVTGNGSDILVGLALDGDEVAVNDDSACLGCDASGGGLDADPEASALDSGADNATSVLVPVDARLSPGANIEPGIERVTVSIYSIVDHDGCLPVSIDMVDDGLVGDDADASSTTIILELDEQTPSEGVREGLDTSIKEEVVDVELGSVVGVVLGGDTTNVVANHRVFRDASPPFVSGGTIGEDQGQTPDVVIDRL